MKIFLNFFLAFNTMSLSAAADLVDDSIILMTRKLEKGSKKNPVVQPIPPPPAPVCPNITKISDFEGEYIYPVEEGGVYTAGIHCPDGDLCSFRTNLVGTIIDTSEVRYDILDGDIHIGGPKSSHVVRLTAETAPENQCAFTGTFSAKNAVERNELKPILLNTANGCSDKVKSLQIAVKLGVLFGQLSASYSHDNGLTWYNANHPYQLLKMEEPQDVFAREGSLFEIMVRGVGNALHVAAKVANAVGGIIDKVDHFLNPDKDPRNPDGTPLNYTNPLTPVEVPAGWVGGFEDSNNDFLYPMVNLSSLQVTSNMDNIAKLTRMQQVRWPEFSWEMVRGVPSTRVYQTLAKYISRLGYDNAGRVWSIICPQFGLRTDVANFNMEVTVTGVRGWTNEPNRTSGFEMGVLLQVWFTPTTSKGPLSTAFRVLLGLLNGLTDLPLSKQKAIQVLVNNPGDPDEPLFRINKGLDPAYNAPWFKVHWKEGAYESSYLAVQVGPIKHRPNASQMTKDFSALIVALFNFASGNMVENKNILSWNLWYNPPELVNQTEWQNHAEYWRDSLNTNGTTPDGDLSFTEFYYFDESVASPQTNPVFIAEQLYMIYKFINKNFQEETIGGKVESMRSNGSLSPSEESEVLGHLHHARFLTDSYSQN